MPDPFTLPPPRMRPGARSGVLVLAVGLGSLAACADRIVAPNAESADLITTPVQSLAVSDVVERVASALPVGSQTTQLNARIARLRAQMEEGRLRGAATTLELAREALQAARALDSGAMAADLTVIELALDDAAQVLAATDAKQRALRQ